jgi:hypothetical protein
MSYEGGLGIALLIWALNAIRMLVVVNSQFEKNLNKVGMRLSWLSFTPKPMSGPKRGPLFAVGKYALLNLLSLPLVAASWVYTAAAVLLFIFQLSKDAGVPQRIKEYRWAMKNQDLTVEQIARELVKLSDDPNVSFESIHSELLTNASRVS